MTDSPTPPPVALGEMAARHREHPPIDGVLGMVAYCAECYDNWPCDAATLGAALDAAERLAVFEREQRDLRHAAWLEERDGRDAADRSAAAWESNYNVLNGEIMAGIEAKLAGAERRVAEAEEKADKYERAYRNNLAGLAEVDGLLAAAARENERLRDALERVAPVLGWMERLGRDESGMRTARTLHYDFAGKAAELFPVVLAALAAEPWEPRGENQ